MAPADHDGDQDELASRSKLAREARITCRVRIDAEPDIAVG
jgi:hypothetical protein